MSRLIVVSNRVDPPEQRRGAGRRPGHGAGRGAARILRPLVRLERRDRRRRSPASSTMQTRRRRDHRDRRPRGGRTSTNTTTATPTGTLWPLFHYRIDLTAYDRAFGQGYERVNRRFAETLAPLIEPGRPDLGARLSPDPAGPGAAARWA